jgi:hypothetical protein
MPRKRSPAAVPAARPPGPTAVQSSPPELPRVALGVFGVLVVVYLLLFYGNVPEQHFQQRTASLNFLVAPDELFSMWCGGNVANFALLDRWPIMSLTTFVLATAWLAGRLVLVALQLDFHLGRLERHVFSLGVGLNLVSLYALLVGLVGGLRLQSLFWTPFVLFLIGNLVLAAWRRRHAEHRDQVWSRLGEDSLDDRRCLWWLVAALPFVAVILLGAMLPPWAYDVREYHLQTPKEWFQNGRVEFLPHNIYANMPLGSEMTALYAMGLAGGDDGWWWGAMAGKTTMACYSLIAAAGLVAFGRRVHSLAAGIIAAVVFLSSPWIVSLATAGYNEGPVALFGLLAIYALWLATGACERGVAWRFVGIAGFCAGAAVACKYPPLLFLVVPLAGWIVVSGWVQQLFSPQPQAQANPHGNANQACAFGCGLNERLMAVAIFALGALVACGPWFAKNWALTNNPTYPLLYSVFDGRTRTAEKHAQWQRVHSPQPDAHGRRFTLRGFLHEIAWNTWRTLWASVTIPPLVCVAWFSRRHWPLLSGLLLWMAYVFVAWWLLTHRLDRFLVLLLPAAALMAAIGVFAIPHPVWRAATLGVVLLGAVVQFPFVALHPDNRYFAPLDRLRRDDRDLGEAGIRVEAAHRWLNANAMPGEKVLLVGDAEPFDLELPAIYNTCFDDCQFTRLFQGRTRDERLAALRAENITYVFFSWAHLARYRSPGNYGYTSDYPTPELVHHELVADQKLLVPIPLQESPAGELFRVIE